MKRFISTLTAAAVTLTITATAFAANGAFSDISDAKYDWARANIQKMASAGYINGYDDGTFKPDQNITKLECIALFARAMGSNDDANAEILKKAHDTYDDMFTRRKVLLEDPEVIKVWFQKEEKKPKKTEKKTRALK